MGNRKVFKNGRTIFTLLLAAFFLSACGKFEGLLNSSDLPPLAGERISILQSDRELTPAAALQQTPVVLPEAWTNKFWPQAGGYPNHVMGHLTLGSDLKEVWSSSVGAGGDRRNPLIAQPVVAEGTVFTLDTEGGVTAFDVMTGKKKWRTSSVPSNEEDSGATGGGLAWALGKIYVTNGYKYLVCINAETGNMLWRTMMTSPARTAPTVANEKVYLITLDNRLQVFSSADGSLLWNHSSVAETTNLLGSASPAVDASAVVLALSSGEILGLRVENGQVVWEDNLSAVRRVGTLSSISDIRGQPVIDRGIVYAASYSGRMVAIDVISGQRVWQREVGSAEMPWAVGDMVFVLSAEQQVLALTRAGGDIHWITSLPRFEEGRKEEPIVWTGPVLAGGRLILASNRGMMAEIDPQDGKILKQSELDGSVMIAPVVADNMLLLLTQQGKLVAYR